ncbi:hypothetical protein HA397_31105, partial [Escherichia coli]|nr:hypothetical protein [Escherichia coli]
MDTASDAEIATLIARLAAGERDALRPLWAAVGAELLGICHAILADDEAAEAALEDIFVKIWHNARGQAQSRYGPRAWLRSIARHHALDLRRAIEAAGGEYDPDGPDLTLFEGPLGDALSLLPRGH